MKHLIAIFLAFAIFLQPFSKVFIYVSFKINQDTIAKTICVKKEIKNNTCQGKCHLKKELKNADQKEQKQTQNTQKEKFEILYVNSIRNFSFVEKFGIYRSKLNDCSLDNLYRFSFLYSIFQPPQNHLI